MRTFQFKGKSYDGKWVQGWLIRTCNHGGRYYISEGDLYNDYGMMRGFVEVDPDTIIEVDTIICENCRGE